MFQQLQHILIEDYNYKLPDTYIAKFPLEKRDESKLLVYKQGQISEKKFNDLPSLLPSDSLLLFNNTKVIQARLRFKKESGAQIEIFCLEPHAPSDYLLAFQQTQSCQWKCMVGNLKKWKEGKLTLNIEKYNCSNFSLNTSLCITAEKIAAEGNTHLIRFSWNNTQLSFADILDIAGELPIPPYLHRQTIEKDKETYQTIYSSIKGSVAAPTAGLHFTPEVFEALKRKGISTEEITLHVGAGTFQQVKSESIHAHSMHAEMIVVNKSTIEHLLLKLNRIVAVGTTSVRTLESLYYIGVLLENNPTLPPDAIKTEQWFPYQQKSALTPQKALENILLYLTKNNCNELQASTQIIIVPGYEFKLVKYIVTNFHQPKSTLLLLVSAYLKGDWKRVYDYALSHNFRFLSYGDSCLLINS